jgi:hypothetical protein
MISEMAAVIRPEEYEKMYSRVIGQAHWISGRARQ